MTRRRRRLLCRRKHEFSTKATFRWKFSSKQDQPLQSLVSLKCNIRSWLLWDRTICTLYISDMYSVHLPSCTLYRMVNMKSIPTELGEIETLESGQKKRVLNFRQGKNRLPIAFSGTKMSDAEKINLRMPTYIQNLQVKNYNGFYLDWVPFKTF